MVEPIIILLVIGAFGGIVRTYLGYETQADKDEAFNYHKAMKSVIRGALLGTSLVMGATYLTQGSITTTTYVLALFVAIGTDVVTKEGYGVAKAAIK